MQTLSAQSPASCSIRCHGLSAGRRPNSVRVSRSRAVAAAANSVLNAPSSSGSGSGAAAVRNFSLGFVSLLRIATMISYAAATSPSGPHLHQRHAHTVAVAVAFMGLYNLALRVSPRLLMNTAPEFNAATAGPDHRIEIPDDADDSGSSVVQEQAGGNNNPSQVVLFLFAQHGRNKRWRMFTQLPLSDSSLSAFLVKATEVSVSGILTLNVLISTYIWSWRQAGAPGENTNSVLKIVVILATIAMYMLTAWVSSMAKAVENEQSWLGVISGFVLAFFLWPVFLGGLITRCMTGAASWKIILVVTTVILIMIAIWATIFNRPKVLRRCFSWCCYGRDLKVVAAQPIEDEAVAGATADRAKAEQEAATAKNRAGEAPTDQQQIAQPVNDEAAAGSGMHEAENVAALTTRVMEAANEADNAYKAAKKATGDAKERARKAIDQASEAYEDAKAVLAL